MEKEARVNTFFGETVYYKDVGEERSVIPHIEKFVKEKPGAMRNSDMKVDIKKVPMVRVTWLDARDTETGWLSAKEIIEAPLAECQEVGWLMVNNDTKVVVMRSWCMDKDDNHGGGAIAIPKGWVTKIEYLEVSYGERS